MRARWTQWRVVPVSGCFLLWPAQTHDQRVEGRLRLISGIKRQCPTEPKEACRNPTISIGETPRGEPGASRDQEAGIEDVTIGRTLCLERGGTSAIGDLNIHLAYPNIESRAGESREVRANAASRGGTH